jgi:hypothetical protein
MRAKFRKLRARLIGVELFVLGAAILQPSSLLAQSGAGFEVKPLGLIDVGAKLSVGYFSSDQDRRSGEDSEKSEDRVTWEEEFYLSTRSYMYHPGFLNMEIGGGPLLVQQTLNSTEGSAKGDDTLFNFDARFNFLNLKSYPFSLYLRRSHPRVSTSLSGRFLTEEDVYGLDGWLTPRNSSLRVEYRLSHKERQGADLSTSIDEDIDNFDFSAVKTFREKDRFSLKFSDVSRTSASGSAGLPIRLTKTQFENTQIDLTNYLGSDDRLVLGQSARKYTQVTEASGRNKVDQLGYRAYGNLRLSETVRSSLKYATRQSKRPGSETQSDSIEASVNQSLSNGLSYSIGGSRAVTDQTGYYKKETGTDLHFNYARAMSLGRLGLGGSVNQKRAEQESSASTVLVFDEPVILNGTEQVALANDFVVASSIVVRNEAKTQVFIEGVDYRLVVVGAVTRIQRLVDGNIADGQTVLVDYEYETSGTAEYDVTYASANASLDFLKYFAAYVRYGLRETDIQSGSLSTAINDGRMLDFVLKADLPRFGSWDISAQLRHTDDDREIAATVSDAASVSASTRLRGNMRLRLSGSVTKAEVEDSPEDVDQVNFQVGLSGNLWRRVRVGLTADYLEDDGGSLAREQLSYALNLGWVYRMVRLRFRGSLREESIGSTDRSDKEFALTFERYF